MSIYYNENEPFAAKWLANLAGNAIVPQIAAEFVKAYMETVK
jgi:hypothetical protein